MVTSSRAAAATETRARILAGARRLLAEGGGANFTTRRVAALANVSHGMCHYHFATKRDLVVALVDDARRDWVDPLEEIVGGRGSAMSRAKRVIDWMAEPATVEVMRVHQAIYASALDDDIVRERLAQEYARWRAPFVTLFAEVAEELGLHDLDAKSLGAAFATAADGFVQQQVLDPKLPTKRYLMRLFERLIGQSERKRR